MYSMRGALWWLFILCRHTEIQEIKASVPLPFTRYTFSYFPFISLAKGNL